ncbi:UFM1 specific peptidase 1 [Arctopsyche grandis]|uniref:UFM1 specific peptidase 1 n=1 Tax=Arctopsyche grandis TaxID=121162 RepID=UPI00406D7356
MVFTNLNIQNVKKPSINGVTYSVDGSLDYYHYNCDGVDDQGWGCGYRTLQSICSWIKQNVKTCYNLEIPSLQEIQKILVRLEDKPKSFVDSREWIGSIEVGIIIDEIFDIPCKIVHVNSGGALQDSIGTICEHFKSTSCPIMMGGDKDCSSKAIMAVHIDDDKTYLLVVDPHCRRKPKSQSALQSDGWIDWRDLDSFVENSFYNLCLPQIPKLI